MARTPAERKATQRERLESAVEAGDVSETDAEEIKELCRAYDENNVQVAKPARQRYRTDRTISGWYERLTTLARELDGQLTDATAGQINTFMQSYVDEKELAQNTVRSYQSVARRFFRYHDDMGVDAGEIAVYAREGKRWDPEDVLTREEIDRLREAVTNPRDDLLFHLLLYTGQRSTAIRTLRVKDVRVDAGETGRYRLNPEHGGLKRADKNGEWRPLLAAEGSVRDWLGYHPDPEPDHYLVTQRPSSNHLDPTNPVSRETIRRVMKKLASEADIDKPTHPHMMRHNFVTICKRDYDMDNDTIKWLIGHAPDSKVMETTYAHLSDEDWIERAEVAAGHREESDEDKSTLTPPSCSNCGRALPADAKACAGCGIAITPDAESVGDKMERAVVDMLADTDGGSDREQLAKSMWEVLKSNPDVRAEAAEIVTGDEERRDMLDGGETGD